MKIILSLATSLIILLIPLSSQAADKTKMKPPFSGAADVKYGKALWRKLNKGGFNTKPATLYVGGPPHGKVREVLEGKIDGRRAILKRNYRGKDVSVKKVARNRSRYLESITVMVKRKAGYDSDNKDWFWVKYKPSGEIMKNPKGMLLAGRIAKGKKVGCIACHQSASGTDMVFMHNKEANAEMTKVK